MACFTNLQPCHSTTHATQICWYIYRILSELGSLIALLTRRDDCIRLLTRCTNSSATSEAICNVIAPRSSTTRCTPLNQFLEPSEYGSDIISPISTAINDPCESKPCSDGFFCSTNRLCNAGDQSCTPYDCQPGCVVGTQPTIVLPRSGGVRVALVSRSKYRYHGYMNCTSEGML